MAAIIIFAILIVIVVLALVIAEANRKKRALQGMQHEVRLR